MKIYQTKSGKLTGTNFKEVYKKAFAVYRQIQKRSKRRTYLRSAYFKKNKIFLSVFWQHLYDKTNMGDKTRRLKYLPCAIELIQYSKNRPESKENPNRHSEVLHRFFGITSGKEIFCVQIKEDKKSGQKYLISVFPYR